MNKNVRAIVPLEEEKERFQSELEKFLAQLLSAPDSSEEYQKNLLADFLKVNLQKNYVNTKETPLKFDKFSRKLFPRIVVTDIKMLPIPDATDEQPKELGQLASTLMDEMKQTVKSDRKIVALNTEIDERVMDLFLLTDAEKQTAREFEVK